MSPLAELLCFSLIASSLCGFQGAQSYPESFQTLKTIQRQVISTIHPGKIFFSPRGFRRICVPAYTLRLESFNPHRRPRVQASGFPSALLPRKEVIQPHLPIRLPCYDFTPVIDLTFEGWLLSVTSPASGAPNSHGVTGGVYKARERIHRDMLIRDY